MDKFLLPHVLERIVDEYLLPKDKMDKVVRMLERLFDKNSLRYNWEGFQYFNFRSCDSCDYDGFTFDLGDFGDYCMDCLPGEFKHNYSIYY